MFWTLTFVGAWSGGRWLGMKFDMAAECGGACREAFGSHLSGAPIEMGGSELTAPSVIFEHAADRDQD